ncbi:MAG TPA: GAF domain-containing protein [Bacteroidetes bacterium]|nr:GAF domain-containing protein [Bacteroidota bacterium]HDZ11471.1 GAF domain-containing protein [Bacteroidota bacterium]
MQAVSKRFAEYEDEENPLQIGFLHEKSFFHQLVRGIREKIGFQWISLYWVQKSGCTLQEVSLLEHGFNMIDGVQFENGNGLAGWVAKYQRSIVLKHVHRGQRFKSNPIKSFMCVPIIRNGDTAWVVNLGHISPNFYSDHSLKKLIAYFDQFFMERVF